MDEDVIPFFGDVKDTMQGIIKVIGVGGGGCNAVRNMYNAGIGGVTYAVLNTDSQSLSRSPVPVKIMLGESGLGAGADPELGKKEAEANINDIVKLLSDGTKMVFVTAGMGGGTGTGAAPVVAGVAKDMGLLTVGVVTIPFAFEKKRKLRHFFYLHHVLLQIQPFLLLQKSGHFIHQAFKVPILLIAHQIRQLA